MTTDTLTWLQTQLAEQRQAALVADRAIRDLEAAIRGVEASRVGSMTAPKPVAVAKKSRRGEVMRVALDCVRQGKGWSSSIRQACATQGIAMTENTVSNVIQRLQAKRLITYRPSEKRYVLRDSEGLEPSNADRLKSDLAESIKAEGSKVVSLKPSSSNGAADLHPPTTALHTA